jgi:hypothetical protein
MFLITLPEIFFVCVNHKRPYASMIFCVLGRYMCMYVVEFESTCTYLHTPMYKPAAVTMGRDVNRQNVKWHD